MFGVREKNTYQKKSLCLKKIKFKLTKNIKTDKKYLQVSLGLISLIIFFTIYDNRLKSKTYVISSIFKFMQFATSHRKL